MTIQTKWDDLPVAEQFAHAGNIDPWAGPIDPAAQARYSERVRAQNQTPRPVQVEACGCWLNDCGECGPRMADGHRPRRGAQRAYFLRHDAMLLDAKEANRG